MPVALAWPGGSPSALSHLAPTSPFPAAQECEALAYLGLDGQVEGTFLERQQVTVVVPRALWVDPHFELQARRRPLRWGSPWGGCVPPRLRAPFSAAAAPLSSAPADS